MKRILALAAVLILTGCSTTRTTNPNGSVTTTHAVDFGQISQGIKLVLPPIVSIVGNEVRGSVLITNTPAQ